MPEGNVITVRWRPDCASSWWASIPDGEPSTDVFGASLPRLLGLLHTVGQAHGWRVEVWHDRDGRWGCGWPVPEWRIGYCGLAAPCPTHYPSHDGPDDRPTSDLDGLLAAAAESGPHRHVLGRRAGPVWLPIVLGFIVLVVGVLLGWWLH